MESEIEALKSKVEHLEQIKDRIKKHEERITKLEKKIEGKEDLKNTNSMREFVENLQPSNHEERALAIGYYLEHVESENNFSMQDIKTGYRKCKRTPYSNMSMLAKQLREKKKWIMKENVEDDVKKYVLTAKGEKYIEAVLEDE